MAVGSTTFTRCLATKAVKITAEERQKLATELPTWKLQTDTDAIAKTFTFANFNKAFGFMARVAYYASEVNHHPDWRNVNNKIDVTLTTHDVKGLSQNDLEMASVMDTFASDCEVEVRFNVTDAQQQ
eukprot:gb/GEZN01013361.1/.p2 GENE.gb/GEZN01013361.1/~~gb/GEZN01013361.1/.p2  ORF type:complete len:127 (-),score=22.48 gb/GEZN01013361.1/:27-407(-)